MEKGHLDELLAHYRLWSLAAIGAFIVFIILFSVFIFLQSAQFWLLLMVLLSGVLWIGTTSLSRHSFILLKRYIGRELEISIPEFLSTQLVVFLFPFAYRKVKKEIDLYRAKTLGKDAFDCHSRVNRDAEL